MEPNGGKIYVEFFELVVVSCLSLCSLHTTSPKQDEQNTFHAILIFLWAEVFLCSFFLSFQIQATI